MEGERPKGGAQESRHLDSATAVIRLKHMRQPSEARREITQLSPGQPMELCDTIKCSEV